MQSDASGHLPPKLDISSEIKSQVLVFLIEYQLGDVKHPFSSCVSDASVEPKSSHAFSEHVSKQIDGHCAWKFST